MATKESVSYLNSYTSHLQASRWVLWRIVWVGPCNWISSGSQILPARISRSLQLDACDNFLVSFCSALLWLSSCCRLQTQRICTVFVFLAVWAQICEIMYCLLTLSSKPQEHRNSPVVTLLIFCFKVIKINLQLCSSHVRIVSDQFMLLLWHIVVSERK